jgi:hypothetical protein
VAPLLGGRSGEHTEFLAQRAQDSERRRARHGH